MELTHAVTAVDCPNCSTPGALAYCPNCGQRPPNAHEYSLAHIAHELTHELFHVDGKIVRTLRVMASSPGLITLDYWEGRRARYLTPLRVYLIAVALYFAFTQITSGIKLDDLSKQAPQLSDTFSRIDLAKFESRFQTIYKLLLAGSVAGLALLLRWFTSRERPYGAYLIGAIHTLAVLFFLTLAGQKLGQWLHLPPAITVYGTITLYWPYLGASMRRWSGGKGWGWVLPRLLGVIVGSFVFDGLVFLLSILLTLAMAIQ